MIATVLLFVDSSVHILTSSGGEKHSIGLRNKSNDAEVLMLVVDDRALDTGVGA